jgi:hypothetical protein
MVTRDGTDEMRSVSILAAPLAAPLTVIHSSEFAPRPTRTAPVAPSCIAYDVAGSRDASMMTACALPTDALE